MRDVTVDLPAMLANKMQMSDVRELQVDTMSGKRYTVCAEAGPPLAGLWSVLKNLSDRARAATNKPSKESREKERQQNGIRRASPMSHLQPERRIIRTARMRGEFEEK